MSIILTGSEGLFTRLGRWGRVLASLAEYRALLATDVAGGAAEYAASLAEVAAAVTDRLAPAKSSAGAIAPAVVGACRRTLVAMVAADQPARSWTAEEAAAEVVRQMADLGESVPACVTSASQSALSPFAGDGLLALSARGRDGADLENLFAETLWLTCVADAQNGGRTRYQEQFRFRGGVAEPDPWGDLWPAGSGASVLLTAADPTTQAAAGQLLSNGSFDDFTANAPDDWTLESGTAGTEVVGPAAADSYDGVGCLSLPGSATPAALSQTFGDAGPGPPAAGPLLGLPPDEGLRRPRHGHPRRRGDRRE
jgi:hypothetical protein